VRNQPQQFVLILNFCICLDERSAGMHDLLPSRDVQGSEISTNVKCGRDLVQDLCGDLAPVQLSLNYASPDFLAK
jgi:hypothetical protein